MIYSETDKFTIKLVSDWSAAGYTNTTAYLISVETGESTFLTESQNTFFPWGGSPEMAEYVRSIDHLSLKSAIEDFTHRRRPRSEVIELEGMNRLSVEGKLYQ